MFQYTTAIDKIRRLNKPIRVIDGGTFAGKTEGIIADYIDRCASSKISVLVTAESVPALKAGAVKIFKNIMYDTGRWCEDHYNYTDRIYRFHPSNATMQFSSFDSVGKAKVAGKRSHTFVNEAQYIPYPIVDELMTRTTEETTFDFNPNNPFYVHEEILPRKDAQHLTLTYKDNHTTPDKVIEDFNIKMLKAFYDPSKDWNDQANVRSNFWANWCKVYIKGELGSLEGVIFQNWEIIDNVPPQGLIGYGMDFGYSNDPTTWIAGYVYNNQRIFDEVIYQKGLDNRSISLKMRDHPQAWTYADSAEPKSIDEIYRYGVKIRGSSKGKDSINFGISLLQEEPFYVTARSVNLIKELRQYCWATDREGNNLPIPEDVFNHGIDAMRYLAMETISKSRSARSGRRVSLAKFH